MRLAKGADVSEPPVLARHDGAPPDDGKDDLERALNQAYRGAPVLDLYRPRGSPELV